MAKKIRKIEKIKKKKSRKNKDHFGGLLPAISYQSVFLCERFKRNNSRCCKKSLGHYEIE